MFAYHGRDIDVPCCRIYENGKKYESENKQSPERLFPLLLNKQQNIPTSNKSNIYTLHLIPYNASIFL